MTFNIAPSPRQQFEDVNGVPYSGGKLFIYDAGSTTKKNTYTDSTGGTANSNPIILNSAGRTPYGIWLESGELYKFVLAPSTDSDPPVSPIFTEDNISGSSSSSSSSGTQWAILADTPIFVDTKTFSVSGDQTAVYQVGRRIKTTNTGGTVYGVIESSVYSAVTDVTIIPDSGILDSGISVIEIGILTVNSHSIPFIPDYFETVENDIINGDFSVAQYLSSFTHVANGAYDFDGWLSSYVSSAWVDVTRVAGSLTGTYARKGNVTVADASIANGDYFLNLTKIEGYNIVKYIGKTFTIGFRAKVPKAGVHCLSLRNSGSNNSYIHEIDFLAADTWQECKITVVGGLDTAGTWDYTTGVGLQIGFANAVGSTFQTAPNIWTTGNYMGTASQVNDLDTINNSWQIENFTMNLGTQITSKIKNYEENLRHCQRYYQYHITTPFRAYASAAAQTPTQSMHNIPMRATPTGLVVAVGSHTNITGNLSLDIISNDGHSLYGSATAAGVVGWTGSGAYTLSARL